jgi:hypothetical protein
MTTGETSGRKRNRNEAEHDDGEHGRSDASPSVREHSPDSDDILDVIDEVLRSSVGLDMNASDELFNERAEALVAGYKQKGGQ